MSMTRVSIRTLFVGVFALVIVSAGTIFLARPLHAAVQTLTNDSNIESSDWTQEAYSAPSEATTNVVRWKPCGTIEYTIDVTDAPMQWVHDIHDAFNDASRATGLKIHYAGRWPHGKAHSSKDPVLIYYKYDKGFPAHNAIAYTQMDKNPSGRKIIGGYIIINPAIGNTSHTIHMRTIYHEVGHAFGLPHPGSQYNGISVMGTVPAPYKYFDLWMFKLVGRQPGEC